MDNKAINQKMSVRRLSKNYRWRINIDALLLLSCFAFLENSCVVETTISTKYNIIYLTGLSANGQYKTVSTYSEYTCVR